MPCNQLLSKYIAITFHNNLTEATVANELIMSVQSLNILNYTTHVRFTVLAIDVESQSKVVV